MWFIKHTTSGDRFYFAADKTKYTVGRVGTDLELQNDICVSRSHALFHVVESQGQLHIEVEDMGSKYGTFHNKDIEKNTPLEKGHKIELKNNDIIRFGRLQNIWKVQHLDFMTATSALSKDGITEITRHLTCVGGRVVERWSSACTHLTMNEPSITVKLLHALIEQKQIVTSKYWGDLSKAVAAKNSQLPKTELYRPSFEDTNINLDCKPERRQIFNGLTFVFLCRKHSDTYTPIVKAAGGACKEITSGVQKAFLIKNNVVVIQYIPATQTQSSQTINEIAEILQSHSKRIIPEYEIGLALLHCSTAEYCNPLHKIPQTMQQTVSNNSMSADLTETVNTKSFDFEISETNENVVTSTPYDDILPSINDKEDYQATMPNIRISETPVDQTNKRKHTNDRQDSDEEDLFQFSKKPCNNSNDDGKELESKAGATQDRESLTKANDRTMKRSMFSEYFEKNQPKNKIAKTSSSPSREDDEPTTSINRKRPHIHILGENDGGGEEDDLFSFGNTQTSKKKRGETNANEEGDDLFDFKENKNKEQSAETISGQDEDSTDMMPTQRFVVVEKPKKNSSIQMPKPKILPRKISAIDWISGSLGKIKIKNENSTTSIKSDSAVKEECGGEGEVKQEPNGGEDIKTEPNGDDLKMTEDHRKWLESLKDAIEIQEVSLNTTAKLNERSHYKSKNNQILNGTINNFKAFVKKYQTPTETNSIQLHLR